MPVHGPLRAVAVALALVVPAAACGGSPPASSRTAATGALRVGGGSGRAPFPAHPAHSPTSVPAGPGAGATTSAPDTGGASAAAASLQAYLGALAHSDATAAASTSDGAALALAGVLLDAAAINRARGATTSVALGPSTLQPVRVGPDAVTFDGSLTLTTTVAGPAGSTTVADTVSGPVTVDDEHGGWRVTGFDYDGRPLQLWPQTATETVGGLHVWVGYVVSYGTVTAILITLGLESGTAQVVLDSATVSAGSATETGTGDFTAPPEPTGILRFARLPAPPTSLALEFSGSNGSTYSFTLPLS